MDSATGRPDLSALRIDRDKKYSDRPKSRAWKWLFIALAAVALVFGYIFLRKSVAPATKVKIGVAVQLTGNDAAADLVATGYVVAQRKAEVASKGAGRLEYIAFEEGDRVRAGDIIARLDNDDIRAGLESARATLHQAEVDTLTAGQNYRRRRALVEQKISTAAEMEKAESLYRGALVSIEAAQASVKIAEVNLANTYIRAPFDGTVLTKNADVGEIVAPFASSASSKGSVVTLADMNSLEVEADVSESNIFKVRPGQRCEIILDAYPGVRFGGRVKKVVPTADRSRATVLTKISFDTRDERVLPEMSARVNFFVAESTMPDSAQTAQALVIPKEALTSRDGASVIFRVDGEIATMVTVQVGRQLGSSVEIVSGVTQGDKIVLSPPGKMKSGEKVEVSP